MATFRISFNGKITGLAANGYEKIPIEHCFSGGSGTPEVYETDEDVEIRALRNKATGVCELTEEEASELEKPEEPKPEPVTRHVGPVTAHEPSPEEPTAEPEPSPEPEPEPEPPPEPEEPAQNPEVTNERFVEEKDKLVTQLRTMAKEDGGRGLSKRLKGLAKRYGVAITRRKRDEVYEDIAEKHLLKALKDAQEAEDE